MCMYIAVWCHFYNNFNIKNMYISKESINKYSQRVLSSGPVSWHVVGKEFEVKAQLQLQNNQNVRCPYQVTRQLHCKFHDTNGFQLSRSRFN